MIVNHSSMKHVILSGAVLLALSGCANLGDRLGLAREQSDAAPSSDAALPETSAVTATALAPATAAPPAASGARTAEALDTTTPEQRAAAAQPAAAGERALGTTVASLGSATEPGLWLKTPLVSEETQGRVTNPATGKSSTVTLIPLPGPATGGSRMSLPALRLIGASLTDLTEVEVSITG